MTRTWQKSLSGVWGVGERNLNTLLQSIYANLKECQGEALPVGTNINKSLVKVRRESPWSILWQSGRLGQGMRTVASFKEKVVHTDSFMRKFLSPPIAYSQRWCACAIAPACSSCSVLLMAWPVGTVQWSSRWPRVQTFKDSPVWPCTSLLLAATRRSGLEVAHSFSPSYVDGLIRLCRNMRWFSIIPLSIAVVCVVYPVCQFGILHDFPNKRKGLPPSWLLVPARSQLK